jgi:hypothetical protein
MKKFLENFLIGQMFKSKKFWYAVAGVLTTILSDTFGINAEEVNSILLSIGALILGQGFADMNKK